MSQWRGRLSEDSELSSVLELIERWYHVPTIAVLALFMFWVRARTWGNFVVDGEVLFSGNDPWYHFREVQYVTDHWPATMPYDIWTRFPEGTTVSQFGTIYDQIVGTVALIVGLGNPSEGTVAMVVLFAPAVMGALMVIPTYYLGKRLGGKLSGVLAVLVIALASGEMLRRSLIGFSDHHIAEAFTQALAVLAVVVALQVADREKPVWELVVDRDVTTLRRPAGYAALAGIGTALYIWTWPPGILLLGIFGLYVTIQLSVTALRGESPEHTAFVGAILFAVTGVLVLVPLDTAGIDATAFSFLQPGLALAGAVWCVFLAWLARTFEERDIPAVAYPVAAFGLIGVAMLALRLVSPDTFGFLINNISRVLVPGSAGQAAGTVGEVQPLPRPLDSFYNWFGLSVAVAAGGVVLAVARQVVSEKPRSELLLVSLWFAVVVLATLTQQRFAYYLTVPIATLTAYVVGTVLKYMQGFAEDSSIQTYQVLTVLTVVMLVIVPMVTVANVTQRSGDRANRPGGVVGWDDSLDYLEEETPAEGTFAGTDNEMDPFATTAKTDDYEYPEGSYGVISWWDYGHWITANGLRIPVANPFQQAATDAAEFLLSDTEDRSMRVLGNLSDGENTDTRYVMADWKMATANPGRGGAAWGKFFAPPAFVDWANDSDYYRSILPIIQTQQGARGSPQILTIQKQAFYETMVVRLYRYHGSAASPSNVPGSFLRDGIVPVTAWETSTGSNGRTLRTPPTGDNVSTVRLFRGIRQARQYVNQTSDRPNLEAQIGGIGKYPSERVPALEHYRLVQASERDASPLFSSQPGVNFHFRQNIDIGIDNTTLNAAADRLSAYTKVFERVPGATVQGQAPANASVTAAVEMRMPGINETFEYRQQAQAGPDGTFEMTLPYSSSGYSEYGTDEGYTNVSVRASGPYEFRSRSFTIVNGSIVPIVYNDTAHVTEGQVIGVDDTVTEVNLTRATDLPERNVSVGDGDAGSGSDGSSDSSGSSDGSDGSNSLGEPAPPGLDARTGVPVRRPIAATG